MKSTVSSAGKHRDPSNIKSTKNVSGSSNSVVVPNGTAVPPSALDNVHATASTLPNSTQHSIGQSVRGPTTKSSSETTTISTLPRSRSPFVGVSIAQRQKAIDMESRPQTISQGLNCNAPIAFPQNGMHQEHVSSVGLPAGRLPTEPPYALPSVNQVSEALLQNRRLANEACHSETVQQQMNLVSGSNTQSRNPILPRSASGLLMPLSPQVAGRPSIEQQHMRAPLLSGAFSARRG